RRAAAEVGGVDEGGAGGIELRHEGVATTEHIASEGRLERPRRSRKVAGASSARHVGVARGVHGDACAIVADGATAAEVGGVDKGGAGGIQLRHEGVT